MMIAVFDRVENTSALQGKYFSLSDFFFFSLFFLVIKKIGFFPLFHDGHLIPPGHLDPLTVFHWKARTVRYWSYVQTPSRILYSRPSKDQNRHMKRCISYDIK